MGTAQGSLSGSLLDSQTDNSVMVYTAPGQTGTDQLNATLTVPNGASGSLTYSMASPLTLSIRSKPA